MTQLAEQRPAGAATASDFEAAGRALLPGFLGIGFDSVEAGFVTSRLRVEHLTGQRLLVAGKREDPLVAGRPIGHRRPRQ